MMRSFLPRLGLLAAIAMIGCSEPTSSPNARPKLVANAALSVAAEEPSYVLLASGTSLREGLVDDVEAAGGTVVSALGGIGVIIATSSDPNFAEKAGGIPGISDAVRDVMVQWVEPPQFNGEVVADQEGVDELSHGATGVGAHETFRLVQWAPDAVNAPAAWNAGYKGAGARVAILDGGIYNAHIDIAARLDVARSRSFVLGQAYNSDVGTFWHGTHVAGIVAAPANNIGTVGIAPDATLIGVKVLHNGSGSFSAIIRGIVYAATPISEGGAGADIINMSLGAGFYRQGPGNSQLANAVSRAAKYANQRGTTVIAAAGNAGVDIDHTANLIFVPAQSAGVIAISGLGPMGWAVPGTAFNLDRPASYTNFGQSAISLGAPGGDFVLPGNAFCTKPRLPSGTVVRPCWVFDMVMAPCRGLAPSISSYCWAAGTSMASPAAAGVAALIVGKARGLGQPISPSEVRTRLEKSADDLGKPGNDDFYGAGRVNALRAIQ